MTRSKDRRTDERNEEIMREYDKLLVKLKEKYGPHAADILMRTKCTELGDMFFLAPRTIGGIIARKLKEKEKSRQ